MKYDKVTTNFYSVIESIIGSDIIIIEGFEFVGKHKVLEKIKLDFQEKGYLVLSYRPDYDEIHYAELVSLDHRFALRYPILEFFKEIKKLESRVKLILDKSIFTDLTELRSKDIDVSSKNSLIMETFQKLTADFDVSIVHITFANYDINLVSERENVINKFGSFDDYFKNLSISDKIFNELFNSYSEKLDERLCKNCIKFVRYYPQKEEEFE
jgi:hypothetical protein